MDESYTDGETVEEWECVDGCMVAAMDGQSGTLTSGSGAVKRASGTGYQPNAFGTENRPVGTPNVEYGDTGTASRFFAQFQPNLDPVVGNPPFLYTSKASSAERDFGLGEEYPEQNADAYAQHRGRRMPNGSDRFDGKPAVRRRNPHATVKPLSMNVYAAQYLATMLLPPAYRRDDAVLLVPFSGVWSEVIGAWLAGWRNIIGCEQNAEYMAVGAQRFDAWTKAAEKTGTTDPKEILRKAGNGVVSRWPVLPPPAPAKPKKDGPVQLGLFG